MKKIFIYSTCIILLISLFILGINYYVVSFSKDHYYYDVDGLESKYVGLVFGASVKSDGTPSDILKDRLKVAYRAYSLGKIHKIIVSGDNSTVSYNEPEAMKEYLLNLGVDLDDIYLDYAGFDTYDSLYRAKEVFLTNELVLFTQDFHLKRAMYIANRLGIEAYGVETNLQRYLNEDYNNRREVLARIKAFLEVDIFRVKPTYLGDEIEIITDEKIEEVKNEILK